MQDEQRKKLQVKCKLDTKENQVLLSSNVHSV